MPHCTVTIPEAWLGELIPTYDTIRGNEKAIGVAATDLVGSALRDGLNHCVDRTADHGSTIRITLRLPDDESAALKARAARADLTAAPFAKWLLCALRGVERKSGEVDASDPMEALNSLIRQIEPNVKSRPEQNLFASYLRDALAGSKIGMVEAGTGVGKTRAMMATAIDWAIEHGERIPIAAPTLALLRQFAAEHAIQSRVRDVPPLRLVFGRREFISEFELELLLTTRADQVDPDGFVRKWVKAGAPPSPQSVALGVPTSWLISTLEYLVPEFPVDEVRLADDVPGPKDRGLQAYINQFADSEDAGAEVVLCTHAMLAQDMRKRQFAASRVDDFIVADKELRALFKSFVDLDADERKTFHARKAEISERRVAEFRLATVDKGLLPDFSALIVDEAHMLEQICSSSLSRYLALSSIGRHMREFRKAGGNITLKLIDEVEAHIIGIRALGSKFDRDMVNLGANAGAVRDATDHLSALARCLDKVPMPNATASMQKRRAAFQVRHALLMLRAATGKASTASYLRFSPMRAYPQLYIGSASVESMLRTLWASLDAGAAVSATLYLKKSEGPSASFQRMLLGIPENGWVEYPPVHAPWSIKPVRELWTAGALGAQLRPPRTDRLKETEIEEAERQWLTELAPVIARIQETSAGGTLVLMTSYRSIATLSSLLHTIEPFIVQAKPDLPVTRQAEAFMRRRRMGQKPLWLAVGAAWTGVDVGGHDPWTNLFDERIAAADDNVLCDLVIPRLPFGSNHSMSHQWRVHNRPQMAWDVLDTAFRFKQGLGRPIRRDGLPRNRRFWILDGRLSDVAASSNYRIFEQLIANYPVRKLPSDWRTAISSATDIAKHVEAAAVEM
jgi:CRISPR type IV-associated DEAD/DEAH-box helicase Csf4